MPTRATTQFSLAGILGNVCALIAFVFLATMGVKTIAVNQKVGWFATILFGTMGIITLVEIFKVAGMEEPPAGEFTAKRQIRDTLIKAATLVVTIFLGIADNFIAQWINNAIPRPAAVWLGTFLTTLVFYPLRGEEERRLSSFRTWTFCCILLAWGSVLLSYFSDWLEAFLTS